MSSKLRILVPVKRVIDFAIKPRINKTGTGIETKELNSVLIHFVILL